MTDRTARKAATSARSSVRRELRGRPNFHANRRDYEDVLRDVELSVERRVDAALDLDQPVRTDGAGVERKTMTPQQDGVLRIKTESPVPFTLSIDAGEEIIISWEPEEGEE